MPHYINIELSHLIQIFTTLNYSVVDSYFDKQNKTIHYIRVDKDSALA